MKMTELIANAPWREAVTYRDTWPHEYVLLQKDNQRQLLEAVCERLRNGEGVPCRFFTMNNQYLFIGGYKWIPNLHRTPILSQGCGGIPPIPLKRTWIVSLAVSNRTQVTSGGSARFIPRSL